jgi:hypothetical protein
MTSFPSPSHGRGLHRDVRSLARTGSRDGAVQRHECRFSGEVTKPLATKSSSPIKRVVDSDDQHEELAEIPGRDAGPAIRPQLPRLATPA